LKSVANTLQQYIIIKQHKA